MSLRDQRSRRLHGSGSAAVLSSLATIALELYISSTCLNKPGKALRNRHTMLLRVRLSDLILSFDKQTNKRKPSLSSISTPQQPLYLVLCHRRKSRQINPCLPINHLPLHHPIRNSSISNVLTIPLPLRVQLFIPRPRTTCPPSLLNSLPLRPFPLNPPLPSLNKFRRALIQARTLTWGLHRWQDLQKALARPKAASKMRFVRSTGETFL